ncbi:hypothetical protein CsSME_00026302 [Camellia sinensis var. sinensis]
MVPIQAEGKDLLGQIEQAFGSIARSQGARSLLRPPNGVVRSMRYAHACSAEMWWARWLERRPLSCAVDRRVLVLFELRWRFSRRLCWSSSYHCNGRLVARRAAWSNLDAGIVSRLGVRLDLTKNTMVNTIVVLLTKKLKPSCPYQLFPCSN